MAVSIEQIGTNRYAPEGSNSINMYSTGMAGGLTLPQLTLAVCLRTAAVNEAQSIAKMNKMTAGSQLLSDAAAWLHEIADGSANWATAKMFLIAKMNIPESALPDSLSSYDKRMQAAAALQDKINNLTQSQQEEMIDLQTIVNRRDVAYSTGSNVVRKLGQSFNNNAQNL